MAFSLPFTIYESVNWRWDLREQKNWEGAKINAQVLSVDDAGVLFSPMGNRPISLLTPPLKLYGDLGGILVITAQCPDATDQGVRSNVRLLWQTESRPDFHFEEQVICLGRKSTEIVFGLPVRATFLYRIGIQFSGVGQKLRTTGIEIPSTSPIQKLEFFVRQLGSVGPILNHSINFVGGPLPLGKSVNYFMVSLMIAAVGIYVSARSIMANPIHWRAIGLILLIVWVAADIPSTWRFARQVGEDRSKFQGLDAGGQIAAAHGGEVAWAHETLSQVSGPGATFAVVSDDPFGPAHRLAYLEAPWRARRENAQDAGFLFVCYSSATKYDANKKLFTIPDRAPIPAEEIARLSPDVYWLRNLSTALTAIQSGPTVTPGSVSLLWVLLGIAVPWVSGMGLILALERMRLGAPPANAAKVIGVGWLAGQAIVIALLAVAFLVTGASHARIMLIAVALFAAAFWAIALRRSRIPTLSLGNSNRLIARDTQTGGKAVSAWQTLGIIVLLGLLVSKIWLMGVSQWHVPARCDDAISIWLFKAKAIAGLDRIPMDPAGDYYLGGSNPHYPLLVPLIAAWLPLVAGQWEERLAALPWLLCYVNLLLVIGGGLRRWLSRSQAIAAAYVVGSLPLLAMHVVRPGYADMLMATFLAGAVLYLSLWRETGRLMDLAIGVILALVAACMKREGPPVVAIAVAVLICGTWRQVFAYSQARRWGLGLAGTAGAALVFIVVGFSDHAESLSAMSYHPGVWSALARHLFEWDSFHALFWIVVVLLPVMVWKPRVLNGQSAAILIFGWCGLIAAIFVMTPQARFALNDQTPSRLFCNSHHQSSLCWPRRSHAAISGQKRGL
jgi:hypothetical protein